METPIRRKKKQRNQTIASITIISQSFNRFCFLLSQLSSPITDLNALDNQPIQWPEPFHFACNVWMLIVIEHVLDIIGRMETIPRAWDIQAERNIVPDPNASSPIIISAIVPSSGYYFKSSIQVNWVKCANEWSIMTTKVIDSHFSFWTEKEKNGLPRKKYVVPIVAIIPTIGLTFALDLVTRT